MQRPHQHKDISGCAIVGIMSEAGRLFSGETIIRSIAVMHERANGLGGGFAAYGIYPERKDLYAIHLMCQSRSAQQGAEEALRQWCDIHSDEPIPTRPVKAIKGAPLLHRYFVSVRPDVKERHYDLSEEDLVVGAVMQINAGVQDAFVFSSGKNMGVFKGVGFPEDIADFFCLDQYDAYLWIAHGRFPTNTTGWWGGAHPFGILDWAVVHNGEISSYGINRRYLANFGYYCTLQTDTEVIAYLFDLLLRKHGLPIEVACMAMAPPLWDQIERMEGPKRELATAVRAVYGGALLNGPFSVVVGHSGGMIGLNDRIKLRPMVVGRKGDMVYLASEEASVREVCPDPDMLRHVKGGEPIIATLGAAPAAEREPAFAS